jgi:hypothetical protein
MLTANKNTAMTVAAIDSETKQGGLLPHASGAEAGRDIFSRLPVPRLAELPPLTQPRRSGEDVFAGLPVPEPIDVMRTIDPRDMFVGLLKPRQ